MGERTNRERIDLLNREKHLSFEDWQALLSTWTDGDRVYAGELGEELARRRFGRKIFMRGIVEFSNCCRNDCLYCGLRRSNRNLERYRLREEEIFTCCAAGYANGFRTFVLQGGEDPLFSTERMVKVVAELRRRYPDCAVTLSIGELERADYQRLYDAGADRYLLRHETADEAHYGKLHPAELSWSHRMNCLKTLKEIGYQTGCGMMVGSPFQTPETLAKDMLFMEEFRPQMIGMGPFLPNKDTPFADRAARRSGPDAAAAEFVPHHAAGRAAACHHGAGDAAPAGAADGRAGGGQRGDAQPFPGERPGEIRAVRPDFCGRRRGKGSGAAAGADGLHRL
jgi:biotin synthase